MVVLLGLVVERSIPVRGGFIAISFRLNEDHWFLKWPAASDYSSPTLQRHLFPPEVLGPRRGQFGVARTVCWMLRCPRRASGDLARCTPLASA